MVSAMHGWGVYRQLAGGVELPDLLDVEADCHGLALSCMP